MKEAKGDASATSFADMESFAGIYAEVLQKVIVRYAPKCSPFPSRWSVHISLNSLEVTSGGRGDRTMREVDK